MKLAEAQGTVERSGDIQESGFRIMASAKAFEILSSKLYSDIPRAIIRELSTNAHDAHVEAGKADKPFDVHLPTWLEPWLEIRDYGPGLTTEQVRDIYTVYFASTRSKSDEFTGCLGLGSKSPFAYTDQFTVTSYVNGTANSYSLFKNEKNIPSVAQLTSAASDAENGIAIRIGIKTESIRQFCEAASQVYHYFKIKPKMTGEALKLIENKPKVEGNGYRIYGRDHNIHDVQVIMGQVCYKVTQISLDQHGFRREYMRIEIDADIGTCSIAASREELQMDAATIKVIKDKIAAILEDMRQKMLVEIAAAPTTLAGLYIQSRYTNTIHGLSGTVKLFGHCPNKYDIAHFEVRTHRRSVRKTIQFYHTGTSYHNDFGNCYEDSPPLIIENDTAAKTAEEFDTKMRARIVYWCENNPGHYYMAWTIQDRAQFTKDFGQPTIKLSQLPDAPKPVKIVNGQTVLTERNKSCIRKLGLNGGWVNVDDFDESDNVAIVHRENNHIMFGGKKQNTDIVRMLMRFAGITTIYGIPTRLYSKYDGDLEDLFEFAKDKAETEIAGMTDHELAYIKHGWNGGSLDREFLSGFGHINPVCADMAAFAKARDTIDVSIISSIAVFFGIQLVDKPNFYDIFVTKYPLVARLGYVEHDARKIVQTELEFYIKAKS